MQLSRRNFLKGVLTTTALSLLPSLTLGRTFLDLPSDGYLFLLPDKKVYWVPEISELFLGGGLQRGLRPATQEKVLYVADAFFHCGTKTWKKFRHPKYKSELIASFAGHSAEEIKTKFLMPREVSHPVRINLENQVTFFDVSLVSNPESNCVIKNSV